MPFGKGRYIKALEKRVADLETYLTKEGREDVGQDHWQYLPTNVVKTRALKTRPKEGSEGWPTSSEVDVAASSSDDAAADPDVASMITILRDLSLAANGGYMGATSHVTMGRLVGSLVKGKNSMRVSSKISSVKAHLSARPLSEDRCGDDSMDIFTSDGREMLACIPANFADRMLAGYLTHASTAFPILHSPALRKLHARRAALSSAYEVCVLHLVYAIGGRFLETTGETGNFFPEDHHTAALKLLDEILQLHDLRTVQTLMLLAIHCLRAPQGPGAWTYVGLAMRVAIDLGIHRRTATIRQPSLANELKKRLFWSCYNLDRQVSITLGRPFTISDRDIDLPLPLDIDEADIDPAVAVRNLAGAHRTTTLSTFIHLTKLRIIESNIQQNIYRVDRDSEVSDAEIDGFLEQLDAWKRAIPRQDDGLRDLDASSNDDERYVRLDANYETRSTGGTDWFAGSILLHVATVVTIPSSLTPTRPGALSHALCGSLRGCLSHVQTFTPAYDRWLLAPGASLSLHGWPHAHLLRLG